MGDVPTAIRLVEVAVAAEPARWSAAGFAVGAGGRARLGPIEVELRGDGAGRGIVELTLAGPPEWASQATLLDGLPVRAVARRDGPDPASRQPRHPNGCVGIDHVVALTPDLDRSLAALEHAGLDLRRVRDEQLPGGGSRQAFFRLGDAILELIEQPRPDGSPQEPSLPARPWGLALLSRDLDATCAQLGDLIGSPRAAIQPGRRIATVRREARLGTAVAFMSERPRGRARAKGRREWAAASGNPAQPID